MCTPQIIVLKIFECSSESDKRERERSRAHVLIYGSLGRTTQKFRGFLPGRMDIQHGGQDHTVARCFESGYFTFYDSPIEEMARVT